MMRVASRRKPVVTLSVFRRGMLMPSVVRVSGSESMILFTLTPYVYFPKSIIPAQA